MIEVRENATQKALFVDGVCQGVSSKDNIPLSPYMKFVMKHIEGMTPGSDCLFLGGGAMLLPAWAKTEKKMNVTVFENDADVYEIAKEKFDASRIGTSVYLVDAKLFNGYLSHQERFDFIFLDIWPRIGSIYSVDFIRDCSKRLTEKGTLSVNFCSDSHEEISEFGKMLAKVFKNVKMNLICMDQDMKHPAQAVFFCNGVKNEA